MNHRHVVDLFSGERSGVSRDMVIYFGRLLKDTWECKRRRDFPDRDIIVGFSEDQADELLDYEVTVYHNEAGGQRGVSATLDNEPEKA